MRKNLGIYVFAMAWWTVLYCLPMEWKYERPDYVYCRYFNPYLDGLIAMSMFSVSALALAVFDKRLGLWTRCRHWGRFGIILGSYTLAAATGLFITVHLHSAGVIGYPGDDGDDSAAMGYIPFTVFYLVAGVILCTVLTIVKSIRMKPQEPAREE